MNTTGSITQGTPSTSLQLDLRSQMQQQQDDVKMDTSGGYSQNFLPSQANYLHQTGMPHHMHHILNIHNHRSLTNSPISNPGSPGLDMIQEEMPQIPGAMKIEQQTVCHPQISVTDVLGMFKRR